jgi:Protein of unknown function (DUF3352)
LKAATVPHRRRRARHASLAVGLCALALATGGCGSSHTNGTSADPSTAVPASAPVYAGAVVRPSGALRSEALAAGKALTHQADPYLRLLAALQTPGSPKLDYAHDVAPWLGPKAGLFLTSLASTSALTSVLEAGLLGREGTGIPFDSVQGALVLDTRDPNAARSFLTEQAKRAGAHPRTYRGVSYEVSASGLAFGLVARFAVIGSQAALRAVIDTTQGGAALSATPTYGKLLAKAPAEALAHVYVNPSAKEAGAVGVLALLTGQRPANVSLLTKAGSIALDADTLPRSGAPGSGASSAAPGLFTADPEASQALAALPGDSWLAIGLAKTGNALPGDIRGLEGLGSLLSSGPEAPGTLGLGSLLQGLLAPLKVLGAPTAQARRDFGSWMGPAGVFAAGSSLLELKAAVVIDSTDARRSRAAVVKLAGALRAAGGSTQPASIPGAEAALSATVKGLPLRLYVAAGKDTRGQAKFVLGLGEQAVGAALAPSSTLSAAASLHAASASVGEGAQPSLMLDLPTLLSLLEGVGLTESPSLAPVLPYLRAVSTISGGGHELGGEVERYRVVVGLTGG